MQINFVFSIKQVLAYAPNEYQHLLQIYTENPTDLNGPTAPSFALFTVKRNKAGYGYASAVGNICICSHDPALSKSITDKLWYDGTYALTNSIFAPYLRSDSIHVNEAFKKNVVVGYELASLNSFAEYIRKLIWGNVFKGAMYAKYSSGTNVAPFFCNNCAYKLDDVYKDSDIIDGDGFVSNIATPTVSIFKERIDLSSIHLEASNTVECFSSFSNALQISVLSSKDNSVISIPGSTSVTLVSHIMSVDTKSPRPPTLCVSNSAFSKLKTCLYCGEFYGGLCVINADGNQSFVIMNGLVFESKNSEVTVSTDIRSSPPTSVLKDHLTDLQFSLVAAEARLNFLVSSNSTTSNSVSLSLMRSYLLWLGETAGSCAGSSNEVVELQAPAIYLTKIASSGSDSSGIPIPFLKYEAYRDTVKNVQEVLQTISLKINDFQNQIRARKAEERQISRYR